jgi:cell division protein FtsB
MTILQLPNVNVPMVDPATGKITREWLLPLQGFITTVTASDITTLTAAVDALNAAIVALQTANTTLQASIDALQTEVTTLESSVVDAASIPLPYAEQAIAAALQNRVYAVESTIVQRVTDLEGKVKDLDQGYQA